MTRRPFRALAGAVLLCLCCVPARAQTTPTLVGLSNAFIPADLPPVSSFDTGSFHSLVITPQRTVFAWGDNSYGQATVPAGLTNVVAVAGGEHHSVAVKADGTVVTWGSNDYGQLNVPAGLTGVTKVACGAYSTIALKSDGTVVSWGQYEPAVPAGLSGVVDIASAGGTTFALKSDGTVVAWTSFANSLSTLPAGLTDVVDIDAHYEHAVALKADGTVVAWGEPRFNQLAVPAGLSGVVAIAAGGFHTLALKSDGTVVKFGGAGSYGDYDIPSTLTGVTAIAAGSYHGLFLVGGSAPPSGPGLPTLAVSTAATVLWPRDAATLSVDATGATGLYALRVNLEMDAARMSYVSGSLAAGALFASGTPTAFAQTVGSAVHVETGRTDGTAATGNGSVATLSVSVPDFATPGEVALLLSGVDAIDPTGAPVAFAAPEASPVMVGGVWPGDMNRDCSATVLDILPVGFLYGATGPQRPGSRDLSWGAKAFSPWGGSSGAAAFASSFADADGNGLVDASDVLALNVNFGQTHAPATGCVVPEPTRGATQAQTIALEAAVGQTVAVDLSLPAPAEDLFGATLRVGGTGATVTAVRPGSLLAGALRAEQIREGVAEAAFVQPGPAAVVSGTGTLVRVLARVDAPGATLSLDNLSLVSPRTGLPVPLSGGVTVTTAVVVAGEAGAPEAMSLSVAPNPARGAARVVLTTPEAGTLTLRVYDALGRLVADREQDVPAGASDVSLALDGLAPGLYVVRASAAGRTFTQTLTVAR